MDATDRTNRLTRRSWPGMASLAKTWLEVAWPAADGATGVLRLPVPPERIRRNLRFPLLPVALRRLSMRIESPGWFNPAPRSVRIDTLDIVR